MRRTTLALALSASLLAALSTWLRASWGHQASALSAVDVLKAR